MEILFLLAGLGLGFVVSFLILKSGKLKQLADFEREKTDQRSTLPSAKI